MATVKSAPKSPPVDNGSAIVKAQPESRLALSEKIEQVLIQGNLAELNATERVAYYNHVCDTLGLNPATRPFEYIVLNGKLTLYARKDCTDQLRNARKISIEIAGRQAIDGVYVVTARATLPDGRADESTGAVSIANLKGDALANAYMKAETKSKRRVTLSICGLGFTDESEIETIPGARPADPPPAQRVTAPRELPRRSEKNMAVPIEVRLEPDEQPADAIQGDPAADAPPSDDTSADKVTKAMVVSAARRWAGIKEAEAVPEIMAALKKKLGIVGDTKESDFPRMYTFIRACMETKSEFNAVCPK